MTATRPGFVLEVLAGLTGASNPVRYPAVYATVDRLFRVGPDDSAVAVVVRWLLAQGLATVRAGGLHLAPGVSTIADQAHAARGSPEPAAGRELLESLGLDPSVAGEGPDDVAIRLLLTPPVPPTWPQDPARGWSLADAAPLAAASRSGRIESTRVRQLWFDTHGVEFDQGDLALAIQRLVAADLVTVRPATVHLTSAGRGVRTKSRRWLSRSDGPWSGSQPLWAVLACLAERGTPIDRPDQAPPDLALWLTGESDNAGRHARR